MAKIISYKEVEHILDDFYWSSGYFETLSQDRYNDDDVAWLIGFDGSGNKLTREELSLCGRRLLNYINDKYGQDAKLESVLEFIIATDGLNSVNYAAEILQGPFQLGERAISKSGPAAYQYAYDVLKGSFPLGEKAISKNEQLALRYACYVLRGPFPPGEEVIRKKAGKSVEYAEKCLKGRFIKAEDVILARGTKKELALYDSVVRKAGQNSADYVQKRDAHLSVRRIVNKELSNLLKMVEGFESLPLK